MAKTGRRTDDPRIVRTQRALEDALLTLGASKPFAAISVAEVVTTAGVSRSTFYDHFTDVEQLLLQTLDEGVQIEKRDREELTPEDGPPQLVVDFLRHVERHRPLYRSALGKGGSTTFFHALRNRIELDLHLDFGRIDFGSPLPDFVSTAATSGIIIGILMTWIETDPLPPAATAADWMWRALPRSARN